MAISAYYQSEIDLVDDTKTLVFTTDAVNYDENEWSYDGLEITGHDDFALEHGAAALMYAMGFRYYAPNEKYIKRPTTIATDLSAPKQKHVVPFVSLFLAYGFSRDAVEAANTAQLTADWVRYRTMNNMLHTRLPAGHRWDNIISGTAGSRDFFNANLDMLWPGKSLPGTPGAAFNLTIPEPQYSRLVEYCAAFMLNAGLNSGNKTHFDPTDSDDNTSDDVWNFSKRVVDRMRAGTDAIAHFTAQAGNPDAQLGLYIYDNHGFPPAATDLSGLYAQLALAYNNTGYSFLELIQIFGEKLDFVSLREYLDTMLWSMGRPQSNAAMMRRYLNRYAQFQAAGARGVHSEFQSNWLANMIGAYAFTRFMKTGGTPTTIYDQTITDVTNDIYDGDPAVHRLFTLWGSGAVSFVKYSLKQWCDIIDDMVPGWYKTEFEQYMVIMYKYMYLPPKSDSENFPTKFTSLMSNVWAVTPDDWFHSYAFARRVANANLEDYPLLALFPNVEGHPVWKFNPYYPTHQEYLDIVDELAVTAYRPPELSSDDLIVVNVTPEDDPTPDRNPLGRIRVGATSKFYFVGPGTAVWDKDASTPVQAPVASGPQIRLTRYTISEGASIGDRVGRIHVFGGTGTYTFTITADPDNKFAIDGTDNALLEIDNTVSYATKTSHTVTISANNGVDAPVERQFTINVGQVTEVAYGPGIHAISQAFVGAGYASAKDGGKIFLWCFPNIDVAYYDNGFGFCDLWMYVPKEVGDSGLVDIEGGSRTVVGWNGGSLTFSQYSDPSVLEAIPSGQLRLVCGEPYTRGPTVFGNINPYLSPYPEFALMSRELADADFPSGKVKIAVPAFIGTDDAIDPPQEETTDETEE